MCSFLQCVTNKTKRQIVLMCKPKVKNKVSYTRSLKLKALHGVFPFFLVQFQLHQSKRHPCIWDSYKKLRKSRNLLQISCCHTESQQIKWCISEVTNLIRKYNWFHFYILITIQSYSGLINEYLIAKYLMPTHNGTDECKITRAGK